MSQNSQVEFYRPFDEEDFQFERCFLCGCDFEATNRTVEHIFPRWLLHRFGLFNEKLTLLNHTEIPYRLLTIPCCVECNGVHLSRLEEKFIELLSRGFQKLTDDDEKVIFQWSAKVLYSTIYKELSLLIDRKEPSLGTILPPETVKKFGTLHLLLQSIRIPTQFAKPYPWSIFVFKYEHDSFHYMNDMPHQCFSMKFGTVGITVVFEDAGAVGINLRWMHKLHVYKLNPLQFVEVSAIVFYGKRLMTNSISYLTTYSMEGKAMSIIPMNRPIGRDWDKEEFATLFAVMLMRDHYEEIPDLYQNGTVRTWLVDETGELMINSIQARHQSNFGIGPTAVS